MRLSYFLVAAAATLIVSCDATSEDQAKLSTATASGVVQSADVVGAGKRQLRSIETPDEDEERLAMWKVEQMLTDEAFRRVKFQKWDRRGVTFHDLKSKLDLSEPNMVKLRNLYNDYLFG